MKFLSLIAAAAIGVAVTGCESPISKEAKEGLAKPVNCETAKADLATLEKEKADTGKQAAQGVSSVMPIGLVAGVVSGTQGDKMKVATGEYNEMIDAKIAQIKQKCGL